MPLPQCMESQYINSRPFRVNAGAVHAYVQAPNGKTAYLSELRSGSDVLVADAAGRTRSAVVGRCKVEVRPMVSGLFHSRSYGMGVAGHAWVSTCKQVWCVPAKGFAR